MPVEVFFGEDIPPLLKAVDLRAATLYVSKFEKGRRDAIAYVEDVSGDLASFSLSNEIDESIIPIISNSAN